MDFTSDRLSTQVRSTTFGALAFSWGMLIGNSAISRSLTAKLKWHLVGVCAAAVLTLFLDFAQYCAGYIGTLRVYRAAEKSVNHEAQYDETNLCFQLRKFFFTTKLAVLSVLVLWLLIALVCWLLTSSGS